MRLSRRNAMRVAIVTLSLLVSGCIIMVDTATVDAEQVAKCRKLMGINPKLEIEPLGYYFSTSLEYFHRFKFIAKTEDPAELFDESIDSREFVENFKDRRVDRGRPSWWWNLPKEGLSGGPFWSVNRSGRSWHQYILFRANGDGMLTVYTILTS